MVIVYLGGDMDIQSSKGYEDRDENWILNGDGDWYNK